ncbi:unnamed protein product [Brassica rapa subsp. narinosa]
MAWKIIFCYRAFEAALQLLLPGKRVEGPVSPTGNRPVYKVHVAPSSSDSGSCRNLIIDFYWGMELYPRIGKKFDIKVFTNCRFSMMCWAVLAVTYCIKQLVTETAWTSHMTELAIYILVAGILCIYINYDCDRQRQEFRRTNRKCSSSLNLWMVSLHYFMLLQQSILHVVHQIKWGLAQHFHYVPEILSTFFWTVPALFSNFLPYFYVIYLTILLFDRAKRDDDRCRSK